jgi:zinc transporter ZupT
MRMPVYWSSAANSGAAGRSYRPKSSTLYFPPVVFIQKSTRKAPFCAPSGASGRKPLSSYQGSRPLSATDSSRTRPTARLPFVQTFAAGAILTMLADTMLPEAYKHGGKLTGVIATLGFATAFGIHLFE